jgi:preprotein translocase subunit SecF
MIDLMSKRNWFFAISVLMLLVGLTGYIVNGLNLDIQFQGGTIIKVELNDRSKDETQQLDRISKAKAVIKENVKNDKGDGLESDIQIANSMEPNSPDELVINLSKDANFNSEKRIALVKTLTKEFNITKGKTDPENIIVSEDTVAPFIGDEFRSNAIWAVIIASILIVLYIWLRFQVMSGLSAGIFAVLALLHDAAIMFSVYMVFHIKINESFVAAILTILGYSMNDTIIIYDRIRENNSLLRKSNIFDLVNQSIFQTLARSINTVLTVLICVTTTYIFAVYYNIDSMKEFTFPLIVGIASGGYSSIFIAAPLWAMWRDYQAKKRVRVKPIAR